MFVIWVNFSKSQIPHLENGIANTGLTGLILGLEIMVCNAYSAATEHSVDENFHHQFYFLHNTPNMSWLKVHVLWLWFGLSASFAVRCLNTGFCFLPGACTDCQTPKNATVVIGSAVWILFLPNTGKTSVFGGDVYGINWPLIYIVLSKIRFSKGFVCQKSSLQIWIQ